MFNKLFTSKVILFIIILFTAFASFKNKRWTTRSIIQNDVICYYSYLPATFIYHDLTFGFTNNQSGEIQAKIYTPRTKDNRIVQKMTLGLALLLLPFFYLAHLYSILNLLPANGYTDVYELSIAFAALFYYAMGLIFLRKVLKIFFDEKSVALTLLAIAFATNLFYYATYECGMSHVYNFCLFSVFLWMTIKWHEKSSALNSVLTGFVFGLITLIRPSNCVVFIFFILYNCINKKTFINKISFFGKKLKQILLIGAAAFVPLSFQLFYWKYATGHWVYYSYGDEGFFFSKPHILEGLFGFRKGLFIYSPVMFMILPGMWYALKQKQKYAIALLVFFIINVYIIFSWWCWTYGGGFGSRAMIDSYGLLALLLAGFISGWWNSGWIKKTFVIIAIGFCTLLNIFQTEQVKSTLLHYDGMNKELYFKIFGKTYFPDNYDAYITPFDAKNAIKGLPERPVFSININSIKLLQTFSATIKGNNKKYLCCDLNKNRTLICNRDAPYAWETFIINRFAEKLCTLQSFEKKYCRLIEDSSNKIFADKDQCDFSVVFKMTASGKNGFSLQACNGLYVTIDQKNNDELSANEPEQKNAAIFTLQKIK